MKKLLNWNQLLEENNISRPRTPIRSFLFEKKWAKAEALYERKLFLRSCAVSGYQQKSWKHYKKQIFEKWGIEVEYPSFEPPRFQTPQEAIEVISQIQVPTSQGWYCKKTIELLEKWVNEVVENAPTKSSMIYVRAKDYSTPSSESYYSSCVSKGVEACTSMCGCIVMIGFNKKQPIEELNLSSWIMYRNNSEVTYV